MRFLYWLWDEFYWWTLEKDWRTWCGHAAAVALGGTLLVGGWAAFMFYYGREIYQKYKSGHSLFDGQMDVTSPLVAGGVLAYFGFLWPSDSLLYKLVHWAVVTWLI